MIIMGTEAIHAARLKRLKVDLAVALSIRNVTGMSMSLARNIVQEMCVLEGKAEYRITPEDKRRYRRLTSRVYPLGTTDPFGDDEAKYLPEGLEEEEGPFGGGFADIEDYYQYLGLVE